LDKACDNSSDEAMAYEVETDGSLDKSSAIGVCLGIAKQTFVHFVEGKKYKANRKLLLLIKNLL
jgi:hypothetical protein